MLTVKAAAARLTVSQSLVYSLVASGKLPAVRIGNGRGTIRIDEADIQRLLDEGKIEPPTTHELRHLTMVP